MNDTVTTGEVLRALNPELFETTLTTKLYDMHIVKNGRVFTHQTVPSQEAVDTLGMLPEKYYDVIFDTTIKEEDVKIGSDMRKAFRGDKCVTRQYVFENREPLLFSHVKAELTARKHKPSDLGVFEVEKTVMLDCCIYGRSVVMQTPEYYVMEEKDGVYSRMVQAAREPFTGHFVQKPITMDSFRFFLYEDDIHDVELLTRQLYERHVQPWLVT